MIKNIYLIIGLGFLAYPLSKISAEDKHKGGSENHNHESSEHSPASASTEAEEDGEHGEEQQGKRIGPDKGITSYDEHKGFSLSKEAEKTFDIKTQILSKSPSWDLPIAALVYIQSETFVYRVRDSLIKRVEIELEKKNSKTVLVRSRDLVPGDAVIVNGSGFVRVAEVDLTSGESGHSH